MHWINNITNEVEQFIDDFMGGANGNSHSQEILRTKFMNGYCYYFAHILKIAFKRGTICWTAPFGHFVWTDIDRKSYDIEGLYNIKNHDSFYIIPEKYIKNYIYDFLHTTPSEQHKPATKQALIKAVKKYCNDNNIEYDANIEDWFYDL